jgi:3-dehydroquinate synthase
MPRLTNAARRSNLSRDVALDGDPRNFVQRFSVPFEYPVLFTRALFAPENRTLVDVLAGREPKKQHRVAVIVDRGAADAAPGLSARIARYFQAYPAHLELAGDAILVDGGESAKSSPELPHAIAEKLGELKIDRQSFVLIVGGGAVLDMAGYAAAITHRGVRMVRVPTTTLAQGDSAVGVKNGINAFGKKNYLGTFAPPFAVLNDSDFLRTLSARDARSGTSEAVKVALIRDPKFYEWISANTAGLSIFTPDLLDRLVHRSAHLHLEHIRTNGDPFELGTARPLDFGHWAAHKLESMSNFALRHGEAVAIGIALDTIHAAEHGDLARPAVEHILSTLERLGFRLWSPELADTDSLLSGISEFREHLGGELTVTMLRDIGKPFDAHVIVPGLVRAGVQILQERAGA